MKLGEMYGLMYGRHGHDNQVKSALHDAATPHLCQVAGLNMLGAKRQRYCHSAALSTLLQLHTSQPQSKPSCNIRNNSERTCVRPQGLNMLGTRNMSLAA
jgi:hypothetical protein